MTRPSCHRFRSSEVRLWLSPIAYNLGIRGGGRPLGPVLPLRVANWSLTSLQQRLVKTEGRLPSDSNMCCATGNVNPQQPPWTRHRAAAGIPYIPLPRPSCDRQVPPATARRPLATPIRDEALSASPRTASIALSGSWPAA